MKRSSFITWDQLKVGVLIIVALLILAIAMIRVGKAGNLFGKRFQLVSFIHSAAGLRIGGPVTVAGQLAGSIKDIKFLPPDVDTMRNLKLLLEVNTTVRDQPEEVKPTISRAGEGSLQYSVAGEFAVRDRLVNSR